MVFSSRWSTTKQRIKYAQSSDHGDACLDNVILVKAQPSLSSPSTPSPCKNEESRSFWFKILTRQVPFVFLFLWYIMVDSGKENISDLNNISALSLVSSTPSTTEARSVTTAVAAQPKSDQELLANVRRWVVNNGGYVNRNVQIEKLNDVLTGMVAKRPMEKGETITLIPRDLVIFNNYHQSDCLHIQRMVELITRDESLQNPFEQYLASRTAKSHHHLPWLWTKPGIQVLQKLLGKTWYSGGFSSKLEKMRKRCWSNMYDNVEQVLQNDRLLDAIAISEARYEGGGHDQFIPFYDVINHANGKAWNAYARWTPRGFELYTTKAVEAGEQLSMTYDDAVAAFGGELGNPSDMDEDDKSFIDTPHLLHKYGFVEFLPQRYHMALSDADKPHGSKKHFRFRIAKDERVDLLGRRPPTPSVLQKVRNELKRLALFEAEFKSMDNLNDIPDNEKSVIWQLHKDIVRALTLVLSQYGS